MSSEKNIVECIKIMRKLPVTKMDDNIIAVSNLIYEDDDLLNEFLQKVDNRIEISEEDGVFIKCEHNRDGDSYRSHHSNKYCPSIEDGRLPSEALRKLEIKFNKMFSIYTKAYYSSSTVCSCYLWDLGDSIEDGFAVSVLIKNLVNMEKSVENGVWESNNIVNVTFTKEGDKLEVHYKLTTSIVLGMSFRNDTCGDVNLSGTVSRQENIHF